MERTKDLVHITSREMIKPSSPTIQNMKPFKLSLLDQMLVAPLYSPVIHFYSNNDSQLDSVQTVITKLKDSLSETLSVYYPLSGRVQDNLYVDSYNEGVSFVEARVNSSLSDFLQDPKVETLNQFLPCQPFSFNPNPETIPVVATQISVFECGGMAIGMCMLHKLVDAMTAKFFLTSWMAFARSSSHKHIIIPDLFEASSRFPPLESSTKSTKTYMHMNQQTINLGKKIIKRYVFNPESISKLKDKAKSDIVPNPTRYEAITCFIWRSAMKAVTGMVDCQIKSWARHAIDIRSRMKPCFPEHSIGNVIWMATTNWGPFDSQNVTSAELKELVANTRESFHKLNADSLSILESENCLDAIVNSALESHVNPSMTNIIPFNLGFTSWFRFHDGLDFGWGDPVWVGLTAAVGEDWSRNQVIVSDVPGNKNIEAWMILGENLLNAMEQDPEFSLLTIPNASAL